MQQELNKRNQNLSDLQGKIESLEEQLDMKQGSSRQI